MGMTLAQKTCACALGKTDEMGVPVSINGKVNVGLGRLLANLEA